MPKAAVSTAARTSAWASLLSRLGPPALLLLGLAALAEMAVRLHVTPPTVAAPSQVLSAAPGDAALLWFHLQPTLEVAACAYALSVVLAAGLAAAGTAARSVDGALVTGASLLDSIPIIAMAPVLVIWLGNGQSTRVLIAAIPGLFPALVGFSQGFRATRPEAEELFRILAARPLDRLRFLVVPSALPTIFVGLRVAAPLAMMGALVAEWMGGEAGLGVLMVNSMFNLQIVRLWESVLLTCLVAAAFYGLVCLAERLLIRADRRAEALS